MPVESMRPAFGEAIFDQTAKPDQVVLAADRRHMRLSWPDGGTMTLGAEDMRLACRCAWCTRARIDGTFEARFEDASITSIEPIGDYALNIGFADGHARGVFPWTYLRAIGLLSKEPSSGTVK
jgi:prepilin-type processing-associated H-X9-DG protein